jgi:acyl carrier protein
MNEATRDRFCGIVSTMLGRDSSELNDDVTFESLGADSLDKVEIIMMVEEEFCIDIDETKVEGVVTVGDAFRALTNKLGEI